MHSLKTLLGLECERVYREGTEWQASCKIEIRQAKERNGSCNRKFDKLELAFFSKKKYNKKDSV